MSISLSLKMLLAGSALAGLTLLACGEESSGGDKDDEKGEDGKKSDAGPKRDAGNAGGKKDATTPAIAKGEPGEDCTGATLPVAVCEGCDESYCVTRCTSEGVWGDCQGAVSAAADAGFTLPKVDSGLGRDKDGGFTFTINDATVPLPTNTCPDSLMCSSSLAMYGFPNICATPSPLPGLVPDVPPSCTEQKDCTDMGLAAALCQEVGPLGKLCLGACK